MAGHGGLFGKRLNGRTLPKGVLVQGTFFGLPQTGRTKLLRHKGINIAEVDRSAHQVFGGGEHLCGGTYSVAVWSGPASNNKHAHSAMTASIGEALGVPDDACVSFTLGCDGRAPIARFYWAAILLDCKTQSKAAPADA